MRSRILPRVPWAAPHFWSAKPLPLLVSGAALFLFGVGDGLVLQAGLGNSPWTIFAEGVSLHSPLSVGAASLATSLVLLLLWIPLRVRIGLNTLLNAVLIALAIDVTRAWLPVPHHTAGQWLYCLAGIGLGGMAAAFYLCANMGAGPRDGIMVALSQRWGWPIAKTRTVMELFACTSGWLLGGNLGIGTLAFAVLIGPVLAATMRGFNRRYPAEIS